MKGGSINTHFTRSVLGGLSTAMIVAGVLLATQTPPPITIVLVSLGLGLREIDRRLSLKHGDNHGDDDNDSRYKIPIVKIG